MLLLTLGNLVYRNYYSKYCRVTCWKGLSEIWSQPPAQSGSSQNSVLWAVSSRVLTIPMVGDFTASLRTCSGVWAASCQKKNKGNFLELIIIFCIAVCLLPHVLSLCSSEKSLAPLLLCSSIRKFKTTIPFHFSFFSVLTLEQIQVSQLLLPKSLESFAALCWSQ